MSSPRSNSCAVARALGVPTSGSASASSSAATTWSSPFKIAPASGLCPRSLVRSGSAPSSTSIRTVFGCPW